MTSITGYGPARKNYGPSTAVLLTLVAALALPLGSSAEAPPVLAKGRWVEKADGVPTSGLTTGSEGELWTVGDLETKKFQGVKTAARLFQLRLDEAGPSAQLDNMVNIQSDDGPRHYDFEGVCALGDSKHLLVVTEREPEPPWLLLVTKEGNEIRHWDVELPSEWEIDVKDARNKRLEGIACSDKKIFLAYERSKTGPKILELPFDAAKKATEPLKPSELQIDLAEIESLNGLHFLTHQGQDYLLALARDQHLIVRVALNQDAGGKATVESRSIRFVSPDGRELCRAWPEGITVRERRIWIINDPVNDMPWTYRELGVSEERQGCEKRRRQAERGQRFVESVPMLFELALDDVMPRQEPIPIPAPESEDEAVSLGDRYEEIRREVESAGRRGKTRALQRLVDEIDRVIAEPTPTEQTACWQLMKATVLVELSRHSDAKALFGVLADTCPIWEALNNLAVLEAADGEFSLAAEHLRRALDRAEASEPEEAQVARGNLRTLVSETDRPSMILAGFARECAGSRIPRADCRPPDTRAETSGTSDPDTQRSDSQDPVETTASPSPEIAASAEISTKIEAAVEGWRKAWSARRLELYFSFYAPDYRPDSETSHEKWREERRKGIMEKARIDVKVENLKISSAGGDDVLVEFDQIYESNLYCDLGRKELVFRPFPSGDWKIIEETFTKKSSGCP